MTLWNSTLKPAKPLQRKAPMRQAKPMARSREKRGPGLAQRIAESLDAIYGQSVEITV